MAGCQRDGSRATARVSRTKANFEASSLAVPQDGSLLRGHQSASDAAEEEAAGGLSTGYERSTPAATRLQYLEGSRCGSYCFSAACSCCFALSAAYFLPLARRESGEQRACAAAALASGIAG